MQTKFDYTDQHFDVFLSYSHVQGAFTFDPLGPQCAGCSVPYAHAQAMEFMVINNVRHLVVDGVPIVRVF